MDEKHDEEQEDEADDLVDGEIALVTHVTLVTLLPPVPFTWPFDCPLGLC